MTYFMGMALLILKEGKKALTHFLNSNEGFFSFFLLLSFKQTPSPTNISGNKLVDLNGIWLAVLQAS